MSSIKKLVSEKKILAVSDIRTYDPSLNTVPSRIELAYSITQAPDHMFHKFRALGSVD